MRKWKILIAMLLLPVIFLTGCSEDGAESVEMVNVGTVQENSSKEPEVCKIDDIKVEIFHFHGTNQCYSCIRLGELAEKTVNTYFSKELESGKLTFAHINAELPENRDLRVKYGVTSVSLWIGTYICGEFHKEVNNNVWYKLENEQEFMDYLRGIIEKRLAGDLS